MKLKRLIFEEPDLIKKECGFSGNFNGRSSKFINYYLATAMEYVYNNYAEAISSHLSEEGVTKLIAVIYSSYSTTFFKHCSAETVCRLLDYSALLKLEVIKINSNGCHTIDLVVVTMDAVKEIVGVFYNNVLYWEDFNVFSVVLHVINSMLIKHLPSDKCETMFILKKMIEHQLPLNVRTYKDIPELLETDLIYDRCDRITQDYIRKVDKSAYRAFRIQKDKEIEKTEKNAMWLEERPFTYNLEKMQTAQQSPRTKLPASALLTDEAFDEWVDG